MMVSIQSISALANQLGFDPAAFLVKAAEKTGLYAGRKAAAVAGKHVAGVVRAVVSYGANRINESLPEYLRERLIDVDEDQRAAIIEAAFNKWLEAHTNEAIELSRLLYRIVYLRALVDYCLDLPVVGGTGAQLKLDDVWVPQIFEL